MNGRRAWLPLTPDVESSPPPVPPLLAVRTSLVDVALPASTPSEPALACVVRSSGTLFDVNPVVAGRDASGWTVDGPARGSVRVGSTGESMWSLGLRSTHTLSAMPHCLPARASMFERGTENDDDWLTAANPAVTSSKITTAAATYARGAPATESIALRYQRRPVSVSPGVASWGSVPVNGSRKWNHRASNNSSSER